MPELRKDPVVGRWVIIATERSQRPTDLVVKSKHPGRTHCPFCEGSEAYTPPEIMAFSSGERQPNGRGWQVRVIPNKFPALQIEGGFERVGLGIYDMMNGVGAHEVIIEAPTHVVDWLALPREHRIKIWQGIRARIEDLYRDQRFRYVLAFKNYGSAAGASLSHGHCQLIATPIMPINVKNKLLGAREHYLRKERCIFCDIIRQERESGLRVVAENEGFIVVTPFASRFPFEMSIYPRRHQHSFLHITDDELDLLVRIMENVLGRLSQALGDPAYNLVLQTSPNLIPRPGRADQWGSIREDYHWHIEILPQLMQVAGFERGTGFYINPTSPEEAARHLKEVSIELLNKPPVPQEVPA